MEVFDLVSDEGLSAEAEQSILQLSDFELGEAILVHGRKSWNGVAILAKGAPPLEIRRRLPGDAVDKRARYVEGAVRGLVIGCLYMPNGNPQPGPKFDYKRDWFRRFNAHAAQLRASGHPVVLAGDYNVGKHAANTS